MTPTWASDDGMARLYLADNADAAPHVEPPDAVITSPPYLSQRTYGTGVDDWDALMQGCFENIAHHERTQVLVNLGLVHKDGSVLPYWEQWRDWMVSQSWRFFGWYVWDQGFGLPGEWCGRLAPSHEFVLHFNKMAVTPQKWTPAKSHGRTITGTQLRGSDDRAGVPMPKHGEPIQPFKIADSVIRVCREMRRDVDHPAVFPVELPSSLIQSYTNVGGTVLDPFMGSGTTGVACVQLGRRFIGIEREPAHFETAKRRIAETMRIEVPNKDGTTQKRFPFQNVNGVE